MAKQRKVGQPPTMKIATLDGDHLSRGDMYVGEWMAYLELDSQTDVAQAAGMSKGYLSAIISGQHDANPTLSRLKDLAKALGLPVYALFLPPPNHGLQNQLMSFLFAIARRKP